MITKTSADTPLTSSQRQATQATDKWVAVVALAGSGKTTVLIERCLAILKGDPSNLNHLLAITFTEKAAAELLTRLRQNLPKKSQHLLKTAWVGTFHSFCARILRINAPLVNLDPSFTILDENAARLLAQEVIREQFISLLEKRDENALLVIEELDFKNAVILLDDLLQFRWHANKVLSIQSAGEKETRLLRAVFYCYKLIQDNLLSAMRRLGAIDFQELEIKTLELLNKEPSVRSAYQRKFKHILVDEFQDTSDIQSELVFSLANPKMNRLAIVGDPRQSIYRFRGANVHCFDDALTRIKKAGGEVINLQENFRSEPAIISFINETFDFYTPPMKAARSDVSGGPAVNSLVFDSGPEKETVSILRQKEATGLASHILTLNKMGRKYSDIACLFQAMTNIGEYEAAFKNAGIPYRIFGGRGLLERQEINDLLHALSFAAEPNNDVALIGLLRSPLIGLSDDDIAMMAGEDGKQLRKAVQDDKRCHLLKFLQGSLKNLRPSEILRAVIDLTGYESVCHALDPSGGMQANLERLIALAQSVELKEPTTLSSFIQLIVELRSRSARLGDPPALGFGGDAVSCMTVHTAKGLEFPVVIIPDLLRQLPKIKVPWRFLRQLGVAFKLKDAENPFGDRIATERFANLEKIDEMEEMEETKRLLYVAMTRARDLLVLPLHKGDKIKGLWHEWIASGGCLSGQGGKGAGVVCEFTARKRTLPLGDRSIISLDAVASEIPPYPHAPTPTVHSKRFSVSKIFSVSELETYEHCPHQYYLKYVLGLPSNDILKREGAELAANVRGSIVHEVIKRYDPSKSATELIESQCISASVYPTRKIVADIEKLITTFAKSDFIKDINKGRKELRFDWRVDTTVITGSIDWLKPVDSGFEIVDFKTDVIKPQEVPEHAAEYNLQLTTYALAASAALAKPILGTTLYFLEPNKFHAIPMDKKRADDGLAKIKTIIRHIMQREFDIGTQKPICLRCPYARNKMCGQIGNLI